MEETTQEFDEQYFEDLYKESYDNIFGEDNNEKIPSEEPEDC